jgi:purine-nucleoside phosphorylase
VQGHKGACFGTIGDKKVVAMQGRFHFMKAIQWKWLSCARDEYLGVTKLIVSNASGVNPNYKVGDIVIIKDINFAPEHPLRGKNDVLVKIC